MSFHFLSDVLRGPSFELKSPEEVFLRFLRAILLPTIQQRSCFSTMVGASQGFGSRQREIEVAADRFNCASRTVLQDYEMYSVARGLTSPCPPRRWWRSCFSLVCLFSINLRFAASSCYSRAQHADELENECLERLERGSKTSCHFLSLFQNCFAKNVRKDETKSDG